MQSFAVVFVVFIVITMTTATSYTPQITSMDCKKSFAGPNGGEGALEKISGSYVILCRSFRS